MTEQDDVHKLMKQLEERTTLPNVDDVHRTVQHRHSLKRIASAIASIVLLGAIGIFAVSSLGESGTQLEVAADDSVEPTGETDSNSPSDSEAQNVSVDGPLVLSFPRNGGDDALISGAVRVEDDGCVTIGGTVVVWPPGTMWDETTQSITLPNGDLVVSGDSVQGGGGFQRSNNLEFFVEQEGADAVLSCIESRSDEIAVFNSQADAVEAISSPDLDAGTAPLLAGLAEPDPDRSYFLGSALFVNTDADRSLFLTLSGVIRTDGEVVYFASLRVASEDAPESERECVSWGEISPSGGGGYVFAAGVEPEIEEFDVFQPLDCSSEQVATQPVFGGGRFSLVRELDDLVVATESNQTTTFKHLPS